MARNDRSELELGATTVPDRLRPSEKTVAVSDELAVTAARGETDVGTVRIRPSTPALRPAASSNEGAGPYRPGDPLGRYTVLSTLGAGGFGAVYAAYDPVLDRRVAIKMVHPHGNPTVLSSRMVAEAQSLAKLAHPNIVAIYDVGTVGANVYLSMEFVDGATLTSWLAETTRTHDEIVDVFVTAARGLEAAHEVGIIHRDVKPDNIIIGKDGRVRLIDFGVALATKVELTAGEQYDATVVVGTPFYMAPEQFAGGNVGPHTDQFSLGVALYEALWRKRPFSGTSAAQVCASVCDGRLIEPPASDVPPYLRAAVLRALAHDPEARHPSMTALIEALAPSPRRRRVLPYVIASGVVASAITATAVIAAVRGRANDASCTGFERELAGVWDASRKNEVTKVLGPEASPAVVSAFDNYARGWLASEVGACRATSVTHQQTAAVLERRMACLDTRRRELDAAVTVIVGGGARATSQAFEIATNLRSLAACENLAALDARPPNAPAQEVHQVEDGIARVRALRLAGEYKEAREHAADVVERARAIGWGAGQARALVERAWAESGDGDPRAARETMFEALRRGDEADDAASQAAAWVGLVSVEAAGLRQATEALRWAEHAEIALAKAGGDSELRGVMLQAKGSAFRILERYSDALDAEQQALALYERELGPRHYRVATARAAVAMTFRHLGKLDDAVREGEASLKLMEELVGPTHPALAPLLNNLALIYEDADRFDDARQRLERALAIKEKELGPSHPSVAVTLLNLAQLDRRAGRFDAFEATWQRAYDIRIAALGASHANVTRALIARLIDRTTRGLDDEGLVLARDVVARLGARDDSMQLSSALAIQCELQRRAGRFDEARASCKDAIAALGDIQDGERATYVFAYAARLAAQLHQDDAAQLVARARTMLPSVTGDKRMAAAYVGWAAAHVELAAGHREAAIREAQEARAAFVAGGQGTPYFVHDLETVK